MAIFLNSLTIAQSNLGTLSTAFFGIRWGHITAGLPFPTEHCFLKLAFEGAKRLLSGTKRKNQKEPSDTDTITRISDLYSHSKNLLHHKSLLFCLLGFTGFMGISEISSLQVKPISFKKDHMTIQLVKSKTDQHREAAQSTLRNLRNRHVKWRLRTNI